MINYIHFPPYAEYLITSRITGQITHLIAQEFEMSDTKLAFYDEKKNLIAEYEDGEITLKIIHTEPYATCKVETEPFKFIPLANEIHIANENHIDVTICDMNNPESRWYLGGR